MFKERVGKAFVQEKAIYKRAPESLSNIINLAQLAIQDNDQEVAKVLGFVLENTKDLQLSTSTFLSD
jgi:hypothetical protein